MGTEYRVGQLASDKLISTLSSEIYASEVQMD